MRKNKKMLMCALVAMGISTLGSPIALVKNITETIVIEADAAEARAYIYEWVYKVIDGHLYKRLFNATKEEYVGDWILVQ